ncbi:competence protein CoiA family protein (plasmid) [Sporosarcina psychrophila]|uniref:competence protein CoiA family protein n=1 Tax=Sporosarcina psychrophila TaxID=1476 RepID=UPI0030CF90CA
MTVNITYAICEVQLVHISDRISKKKTYCCPSCGEAMVAKKGAVNAHHFSHKADSSCTATEETMLHLLAKYFLISQSDLQLNFPVSLFKNKNILFETISTHMVIEYIPVQLQSIFEFYSFYNFEGTLEKSVGNFIADVLFIDPNEDNFEFVIEVFVTHAIEENKRAYFNQVKIPFIEVKPKMNNGQIEFFVTETNIYDYLYEKESKLTEELFTNVYEEFRGELLQKLKYELVKDEKIKLEKLEALKQLNEDIDDINLREHINRELYTEMSTIPATTSHKFERIEKVSMLHLKGKNLKCNNKFVNLEAGILHSLITNFQSEQIIVQAYVETGNNNKEHITGFNFKIPRQTVTGDVMKAILKKMAAELMDPPPTSAEQ